MGCSIPQISPHFHAYMYDARLLLLSTPKYGLKIGREEKGVSGVTFIFFWGGGVGVRYYKHLRCNTNRLLVYYIATSVHVNRPF